jgi:hypothetical protein
MGNGQILCSSIVQYPVLCNHQQRSDKSQTLLELRSGYLPGGHSTFALNITVSSLMDVLLLRKCCDMACDRHAELQEADCRR